MAAGMIDSYSLVGTKENVRNDMDIIGPKDYYFTKKLCGRGTCTQRIYSRLEETIRPPKATNAHAEGAKFVADNVDQPVERIYTTQNFHEVFSVTGSAATDDVYGRTDELARQRTHAYINGSQDLEYATLNGQAMVQAGARTFAAVQNLIAADLRFATGGAGTNPSYTNVKVATAALAAKSQRINVALIPLFDGDLPGDFVKNSNFVRQVPNTSTEANDVIDFIRTPTATLDVKLSQFMAEDDWLLTKPKNFSLVNKKGRDWTLEKLAKDSDGDTYALYGEFSLEHRNWSASAVIRKVTGTVGADGIARF